MTSDHSNGKKPANLSSLSMTTSVPRVPAHRSGTADLLKGIAVMFMVQVHLFEQFATEDIARSLTGKVSLFLGGPPAAPVFLAVMGYFLALTQKNSWQLVRRGVLLILGGVLLNIGLNAHLLAAIHGGQFHLDPYAFIFGADILPLAGMSVIIIAALRTMNANALVAFALALFVASIAQVLPWYPPAPFPALCYVNAFFWGEYWWSYFPLFPWLAYSLLGFAFCKATTYRQAYLAVPARKRLLILVFAGALLVFSAPYAVSRIVDLSRYYHHGMILLLWIAGFLFLWLMVAASLEKTIGESAIARYLRWLGRNVTSAYVFQWLIIGNLATEFYRSQHLPQLALWFVAVMVAMSLLVLGFSKALQALDFNTKAQSLTKPHKEDFSDYR
jgi:uncharacterized membrane protein